MKILLLFTLFIPTILSSSQPKVDLTQRVVEEKVIIEKREVDPIEPLINALIQVESRGNSQAIGDTHLDSPSIGLLQIRPIMVREVNRILKLKGTDYKYKLSDRKDSTKSVEMFYIWYEFHHKDDDFEVVSRCWNGGGRGHLNPKTEKYWAKVQQALEMQYVLSTESDR